MLWGLKLSKSQYRLTVVSYGGAPREGIVMLRLGCACRLRLSGLCGRVCATLGLVMCTEYEKIR